MNVFVFFSLPFPFLSLFFCLLPTMMRFLYTSIYSLTCNPPEDTYMYLGTHQVQYLR